MIAIAVDRSGMDRLGKFLGQLKNPRPFLVVLGREGANRLRTHFLGKNRSEPNKLGGRRENFWRKVAHATQAPLVDGSGRTVTISVNHPAIAQKIHGGIIRAKRAKNLSIPVSREAYGRYPATFERETGLKLVFLRQKAGQGVGLLASVRGQDRLQVEYVLKREVSQSPDPTALPPRPALERALIARGEAEIRRTLPS